MTSREKVLLSIFIVVALLGSLIMYSSFYSSRKSELTARQNALDEKWENLDLDLLNTVITQEYLDDFSIALENTRQTMFSPDEMDIYTFGQNVKRELERRGMEVASYKSIQIKGHTYMDFSFSGNAESVLSYFKFLEETSKQYLTPYVVLKTNGDNRVLTISMRIGYAELL